MSVDDLRIEEVAGEEWADWYRLTTQERFIESMKLWDTYLALGGSLEPEPDTQSPFFDPQGWRENASHGRQACVFYGAAEFSRDLDLLASSRPVVQAAPSSGLLAILQALREEENEVRHRDRLYWEPLKRELEDLRRKRREHGQTKL